MCSLDWIQCQLFLTRERVFAELCNNLNGSFLAQKYEHKFFKFIHSFLQYFQIQKLTKQSQIQNISVFFFHSKMSRVRVHIIYLYIWRRLGWSTWIRWPLRLKHGIPGFELTKEDMIPFDITRIWAAMEEISRLGLAKSIGVSNFGTLKLSQILHNATIPPAVNQVEMNPSWQQGKLRDFCKERNSCDCVVSLGTLWISSA